MSLVRRKVVKLRIPDSEEAAEYPEPQIRDKVPTERPGGWCNVLIGAPTAYVVQLQVHPTKWGLTEHRWPISLGTSIGIADLANLEMTPSPPNFGYTRVYYPDMHPVIWIFRLQETPRETGSAISLPLQSFPNQGGNVLENGTARTHRSSKKLPPPNPPSGGVLRCACSTMVHCDPIGRRWLQQHTSFLGRNLCIQSLRGIVCLQLLRHET
ncbi:hypothetical protein LXA43DRAFT_1062171 [Ganoderma leucocontextum]|nr:hypothetical protein LXA43DRAFT_1062171 [Ganoderma leucocontextum]